MIFTAAVAAHLQELARGLRTGLLVLLAVTNRGDHLPGLALVIDDLAGVINRLGALALARLEIRTARRSPRRAPR